MGCTETHCIYERLWYNSGHFYLLVDGDTPVVRSQVFVGQSFACGGAHFHSSCYKSCAASTICTTRCELSSSTCLVPTPVVERGTWILQQKAVAIDPFGRVRAQTGWKMSRNLDLNVLHVDDATAWADNVAWRPVSGDTLVFDYVYFLHPVRPKVLKRGPVNVVWNACLSMSSSVSSTTKDAMHVRQGIGCHCMQRCSHV